MQKIWCLCDETMIGCFAKIYKLGSSNMAWVGYFAISFYDLVCSMFESGLIVGSNAARFAEPRCTSTHGGSMQLERKYRFFPMPIGGGTSRTSAYV